MESAQFFPPTSLAVVPHPPPGSGDETPLNRLSRGSASRCPQFFPRDLPVVPPPPRSGGAVLLRRGFFSEMKTQKTDFPPSSFLQGGFSFSKRVAAASDDAAPPSPQQSESRTRTPAPAAPDVINDHVGSGGSWCSKSAQGNDRKTHPAPCIVGMFFDFINRVAPIVDDFMWLHLGVSFLVIWIMYVCRRVKTKQSNCVPPPPHKHMKYASTSLGGTARRGLFSPKLGLFFGLGMIGVSSLGISSPSPGRGLRGDPRDRAAETRTATGPRTVEGETLTVEDSDDVLRHSFGPSLNSDIKFNSKQYSLNQDGISATKTTALGLRPRGRDQETASAWTQTHSLQSLPVVGPSESFQTHK